jgi:hypothetical protein
MTRLKLLSVIFLAASASFAHADSYGRYVGSVQTEWLEPDRKMRLLAPFSYIDPNGHEWRAPKGWVIDGASIPRFAWSIVGGPYDGKYRNASVIHDVACDEQAEPWEQVHETFYWAMLASEVEPWRAKLMYAAVYHFGPRWTRVVTVKDVPQDDLESAPEQALTEADPASRTSFLEARPKPRVAGEPQLNDVDVRVEPPPQKLNEQDFEKLKTRIIEAENRPADTDRSRGWGFGYRSAKKAKRSGISLEEIREFEPTAE